MKFLLTVLISTLCLLTTSVKAQDLDLFNPGAMMGMGLPAAGEKTDFKSTGDTYEANKPTLLQLDISFSGDWHSYYQNPGTTGLPTEIELKAPEGFKIAGPYWGIPTRGGSADMGFYYGYATVRFAWIITPTESAPEEATFTATSSWQLCGAEGCQPPTDPKDFSITLKKGTAKPITYPADIAFPQNVASEFKDWSFSIKEQTKTAINLTIKVPANTPPIQSAYFFDEKGYVAPDQDQTLTAEGDTYTLSIPLNTGKNGLYPLPEQPIEELKGILSIKQGEKSTGLLISETLTPKTQDSTENSVETIVKNDMGLGGILFALFLGGFILNLMPCVFPVIGLKIMSFVEMGGGDRKKVLMHSLTFVLGVLLSFWIITTLLLILKQSIPSINWAFWLENPWVILVLLFLMLGLGLNMLGIFEIGVAATSIGGSAQQKKGFAGSFYSGILATVVATPCSAPFLGAAMGPALNLSAPWMFIAFTCMGLGLSLPYLILGALPQLTKYLPRPGAWMESFKQGLSFLLFGTAVWLLWTYWAFFPEEASLASLTMLFGLVLFATACWIKGRWDLPYKTKRVQWIARILVLILLASSVYLAKPYAPTEVDPFKEGEDQVEAITWETWSPEAQQKAMDENRPVFIDFTARWCATCQVNKSVAYDASVRQLVKKYNILMLKADKTTSNPTIDAELKKLGKTSVPVNVLYIPGDTTPYFTNVNLTSSYLGNFFQEHLGDTEK